MRPFPQKLQGGEDKSASMIKFIATKTSRREEILCGSFLLQDRIDFRIPCFAVRHRRREASPACGK